MGNWVDTDPEEVCAGPPHGWKEGGGPGGVNEMSERQSQYLNMGHDDWHDWFFKYLFIQQTLNFYSVESTT